ncbi:hypothetical protein [Modicisalibacter luteus]|uniref:hypothetical protein n=1 Tax=Modicisalibacter luteus TaxID=453962 RepID=UPI00362C69C4
MSRQRILAVEEQGDGRHATQRLVTVTEGHCGILAEGADFYGAPALSPDGCWLAWVEWDLPICLGSARDYVSPSLTTQGISDEWRRGMAALPSPSQPLAATGNWSS